MNETTEFWQEEKEEYKERCEKRNNNYEPKLIELGATKKSDAVFEYDGWFCYPTKGFAMEKKNTKNRMGLDSFIKSKSDDKSLLADKLQQENKILKAELISQGCLYLQGIGYLTTEERLC